MVSETYFSVLSNCNMTKYFPTCCNITSQLAETFSGPVHPDTSSLDFVSLHQESSFHSRGLHHSHHLLLTTQMHLIYSVWPEAGVRSMGNKKWMTTWGVGYIRQRGEYSPHSPWQFAPRITLYSPKPLKRSKKGQKTQYTVGWKWANISDRLLEVKLAPKLLHCNLSFYRTNRYALQ